MKEQASQVLECITHHKALLQDVSIAHDILTPEAHTFHTHITRSLTRVTFLKKQLCSDKA